MSLIKELRDDFMGIRDGQVISVSGFENDDVIVFRNRTEGIMVGIKIGPEVPSISETFTSCHLFDSYFTNKEKNNRYLFLACKELGFSHEFASLCCDFVDPGEDGRYRKELLSDPFTWWKKWIELLGNTVTERNVYSVIAEMIVLDHLFQKDKTVVWTAANAGVRDLETESQSIEVKSTVRRTEYEAVISSSFQLKSKKPLWLVFVRMEENSHDGYSIADMYGQLIQHGYDSVKLQKELKQQGIDLTNHICKIKYRIIERIRYRVDDNFPKIVDSSFVDGRIPKGVDKITYTVDLNSVNGEAF